MRLRVTGLILALGSLVSGPASAGGYRIVEIDGIVHVIGVEATAGSAATDSSHGYESVVRAAAARHRVDPRLVEAVIRVESAFDPRAQSPKGARGLMQLMPRTAARLGVRDPFDAPSNIDGGVRHLRYLLDRYAEDVSLALAAYNAGEDAVNAHRGIPPYPETREYVERVLRWAGVPSTGSLTLYRVQGRDGTVVLSNLPPRRGSGSSR